MNFERKLAPAGGSAEEYGDSAPVQGGRRRLWVLLVGAVLVAAALIAAYVAFRSTSAEDPAGSDTAAAAGKDAGGGEGKGDTIPNVTVVIPGTQTVERTVSATGSIAARREMPVGVSGEGGQVTRVLVEPGQWVSAGQTLAVIDSAVQAQQANSLAAQIRVAEADAQLAQSELVRAEALVGRGFISKADLDRKRATRDAAAARVRVAQAQFSEAQARNRRLDIRAPAAGLVLTRQVEPGQVVSAGSGVLFRMARGGEMELLAQLGESDLQKIALGSRASVRPVGTDADFAGQIWQVAPVVDPQSRQGIVRIALPYAPALRPGGFGEARIVAGVSKAPLLPESAVLSDAQGNFVLIVGKDERVERRAVRVGSVTDAGVAIVEGLSGNENVVVSAGAFLNPGEKIKPVRQARAAS